MHQKCKVFVNVLQWSLLFKSGPLMYRSIHKVTERKALLRQDTREEETWEVSTPLSTSFPLGTLADSGGEAERPSSAFTSPVVLQGQGTGSSGLSRLQGWGGGCWVTSYYGVKLWRTAPSGKGDSTSKQNLPIPGRILPDSLNSKFGMIPHW